MCKGEKGEGGEETIPVICPAKINAYMANSHKLLAIHIMVYYYYHANTNEAARQETKQTTHT